MKQKSAVNLMRKIKLKWEEILPLLMLEDHLAKKFVTGETTKHEKKNFNISKGEVDYNLELPLKLDIDTNSEKHTTSFESSTPFTLQNLKQAIFENYKKSNFNNMSLKSYAQNHLENVNLVQVRMQDTTVIDNSNLRLIYSVHLGGKPVPAETAASDMALLSPQEVALELGTPVLVQSTRKLLIDINF